MMSTSSVIDNMTIMTNFSPSERKDDTSTDLVTYEAQRMIGHGAFGAVFIAVVQETGETVAIKKVLQDPRFKNRELQILRMISKKPHPYIVSLRHYFVSKGSKSDDIYLNLVMDFVPDTIFSVARYFAKRKEFMPLFSVKVYIFQLARALAHIHGLGICHRDIKPHNLLVDPHTMTLKLCDFGSAKVFVPGEPNVAYICSRFYRAPELIFGSTDYTFSIDVWSMGCVFAELLIGSPLFPGNSGVDQLVEIIKILGTPSKEDLKTMNPNYQEFKFPQIRAFPWSGIFRTGTPGDVIDCIRRMLCFNPRQRIKAIESCAENCFSELRNTCLHNNDMSRQSSSSSIAPEIASTPSLVSQNTSQLLQFTPEELSLASADVRNMLVPNHCI